MIVLLVTALSIVVIGYATPVAPFQVIEQDKEFIAHPYLIPKGMKHNTNECKNIT